MTNNKVLKFLYCGFVVLLLLGFWISFLVLKENDKKWIQKVTDYSWPQGINNVEIIEQSWLFARASRMEVFFVIPQNNIHNSISNNFWRFDPSYDCKWTDECKQKRMDWNRWRAQKMLFGQPAQFPKVFYLLKKSPTNINLSNKIYFRIGNMTGMNPYFIIIDESSGYTWIHVSMP
jgi:hypothetical protein